MSEDKEENTNTSEPKVAGRKNYIQDPAFEDNRPDEEAPKLHEKHKELKIAGPSEAPEKAEVKATRPEPISPPEEPKDESRGVVDDSIVDAKVPPPPNMTIDNPASKLIKEKTYRLPVHRGTNKTTFKIILLVWFVACVIAGSVYVLVY